MARRGFTLIELSVVLAMIGVLAAIAAPGFRPLLLRSRASEAPILLEAIAHAELAYHRDHGKFLACASTGEAPPRGTVSRFDATKPGWSSLGIAPDGGVRFVYEVALEGTTFKAVARGDLDGDGTASTWTLRGDTLATTATDELE